MILNKEVVREKIFRAGVCSPVIITVAHDGGIIAMDKKELPVRHPSRRNDEGAASLALQILHYSLEKPPRVLCQGVERQRLTREMILDFFYETLFEAKESLARCGKCFLIDLHVFAKQPAIGNFDIIFGTNHRETIVDDFDRRFAAALQKAAYLHNLGRELKVYIPASAPKEGEKFCAAKNMALVKWVKGRDLKINAVQAEIYKDWLSSEDEMRKMARIFSDAIKMFV